MVRGRNILASLIAVCWLAVACAPVGPTGGAMAMGVDIRGAVTGVRQADARSAAEGILGVVVIDDAIDGDTRYARAVVTIRDTTRIYAQQDGARRAASFADLRIGQLAQASFAGPVLQSDPVQATAAELMILLGTASAAAEPVLVLDPDRGPCSSRVVARGANFPPGKAVRFLTLQVGTDNGAEIPGAGATVAADGTFAALLPFVGFACTGQASVPEGTRFLISAITARDLGKPDPDDVAARATFTVTDNPARCFPETGFCVRGRFLTYWETHGLDLGDPGVSARESLALFGYPISEEFSQTLEDGREYTVQYFERARFERHPENAPPYDVLLGAFGRRFYPLDPPVRPEQGARYFPATGHNVGGRFAEYWEANGGLPVFGLPISEPLRETLEDGNTYHVQYFERARFEAHPTAPPYDVQLGQFGRRALAEEGLGPPVPTPTFEPCRADGLGAAAGWRGGGQAVATFVILTNQGATPCTLPGRPRIQLVDAEGHPLPVEEGISPEPDNRFALQPGQRASATFVWRNWCRPSPAGPLSVRLTLPGGGGQLTVRNGQGGSGSETPRCDAPTAASTLVVSPFGRLNP